MKTRHSVAGLVIAALLFGAAGMAFAAPTVPGAVYGDSQARGVNKPAQKVMEDLQKAGVKDVRADHWAAGSITVLLEAGLVAPDTQGRINPDAAMTTEKGVAVFSKVLGIASKTDDDATAAEKAKQAGLTAGSTDGEAEFTRMEVARLLAAALGVQPKAIFSPDQYPFKDYSAVGNLEDLGILAALYELGIFKGYEDGTFQPDGVLTTAQLAILVDRVLGTYK